MNGVGAVAGVRALRQRAHQGRVPIARRDLAMRNTRLVIALRVPTFADAHAVRAALCDAAATGAGAHFLCYLDAENGYFREVAPADREAFSERAILAAPAVGDRFLEQVSAERARGLEGMPYRCVIGPDSITLNVCHALGDSITLWPFFLSLFQPKLFATLAAGPAPVEPLASGLWNTFGRDPRRAVAVLRGERPALPVSGEPGADDRDLGLVGAISVPGYRQRLAAQLKVSGSGSTVGALVTNALRNLHDQGIPTFSGVLMVADARRYLPSGQFWWGNFSSGAYLPLPELEVSAVSARISDYANSGRALLTLAAISAGQRRHTSGQTRWQRDEQGRCLMSFSYVGTMPWPGPDPIDAAGTGDPIGVGGISVICYQLHDRLWATVTYDRGVITEGQAQSLADSIVGR